MPDSFFGGGNYNSGYGSAKPTVSVSRPSTSSVVSNYSQYRSPTSTGYSGTSSNNSPSSSSSSFRGATQAISSQKPSVGTSSAVNAAAATAAAMAVARAAQQSQQNQQQGALQNRSPLQMQANAQALSRGSGLLNKGVPGTGNLNPYQVTNSLAGAFADKSGLSGPAYSRVANDLQRSIPLAAKTLSGEVYGLGQNDYTAAANTMFNRMALRSNDIGSSALYGDSTLGSTLPAYDANGLRYAKTRGDSGVPANSAFKASTPGTMEYAKGLMGLAEANSTDWLNNAPQGVVNATHYYTGATPKWARGQEKTQYGAHKFVTPSNEFSRTQVAEARNNPAVPSSNQVAVLASRVTPQGTLENYFKPQPTAAAPQSQSWGEWASNLASQGNEYLQAGIQQAKSGAEQISALPGGPEGQAALIKNATGQTGLLGKLLSPVQYAGEAIDDWVGNNVSAPKPMQSAATSAGQLIGSWLPKGDSTGAPLGFAPTTGLQVYPGSTGTVLSGGGGDRAFADKKKAKKKDGGKDDDKPKPETDVATQYYPQYYSTWANLPKGLIKV